MVLLSVFLSVFATGAAASKCRPSLSTSLVSHALTTSANVVSNSLHPTTTASEATLSESTTEVVASTTTEAPLAVDNLVVNGNIGTPGQDSGDIYGFEHGIRARAVDQGGYTGSGTGETRCVELSIFPSEGGNPTRKRQSNTDTDRSTSIWQHISIPHARPVFQLFYKVLQVENDNDCKVNVYYGNQLFLSSDSFQGVADWRAISGMPSLTTLSSDLRVELRCINAAKSPAQILVDQMFMSGAIGLADLDRVKIDWKAATLVQPTMSNTISGETSQANPSTTDTQSTSETAISSQADTSTTSETAIVSTDTRSNTGTFLSSISQLSSVAESELATSLDTLSTSSETLTSTSPLMSESSLASESTTSTNIESETSAASDSSSAHILESTTSESATSTALESTTAAAESITTNALSTSDISSSEMSTETSSITSWTLTVSATAMPTSTMPATTNGPGPLPTSIDDLSPAAKEIFDFIMDKLTPDDRNLHIPAPAQSDADKVLHSGKFDPNDTSGQEALASQLVDMGLDPVDDFVESAEGKIPDNDPNSDDGVCPNPSTKRGLTRGLRSRRDTFGGRRLNGRFAQAAGKLENYLAKRDGWDYGCNEALGEFLGVFGDVGTAHELVCSGKDMWDSRDAFVCLFGGCGPTVKYEEWTYTWNYEWVVDFPTISEWIAQPGDGSSVRCLDCSMKLTSLKFTGTIVVWLVDGKVEIKSADLTPEVVGKANMLIALQATRAWESQWNWVFEAAPLETIEEKGAYSIRSKVLYEFGVKWKTASAISVASAGASFSLNAQANLDISDGVGPTLRSKKGWEPQVTYSYPVFTTSGGVSIIPYLRWGVEFDIDIYNQVRLKPALSSQTLVTIQSSYSDEPQGQCPADKLAVSTYMSTKSVMKLRNGVYDTLYSGSSRAYNQCFEAPDMIPTAEDIAELSEFAGEFCTSYLNYKPPRTTSISTATSTSGSTTTTEYVTSWIPATAQYVIVTVTSYFDRTGYPQIVDETVTTVPGTATFPHLGLKRRDATATQELAARAIFTPGLVQDWDTKKISFACKQIATGTETVTQPVTTTIGVGIATITSTTTVASPGGDVKFYTNSPYQWRYIGSGEAESKWLAAACSSPSKKSGKCFKIRINGPKWTDGQYLRYHSSYPDSFVAGNGGYPFLYFNTWYLSETGRLITQNPYARAGFVAAVRNSNNIIFGTPISNPNPDGTEALYCHKDPNDVCSGVLSCSTDTRNGLSFTIPKYDWYRDWEDARFYNDFRPRLGDSTPGSEMATFTWEAADCACE